MAVVEDFSDTATCALGNFSGALSGTYADVFSGDCCALTDVAGGVEGVEGDEVSGAFSDAFGCGSCSLGGAFADIAGTAANVTTGTAGLGLWRGLSLCGGWRGRGLGLAALGADGKGEGEKRNECSG